MLTNCLAACVHLSITVSEIQRDIDRKSSIFFIPLAFIIIIINIFVKRHRQSYRGARVIRYVRDDGQQGCAENRNSFRIRFIRF